MRSVIANTAVSPWTPVPPAAPDENAVYQHKWIELPVAFFATEQVSAGTFRDAKGIYRKKLIYADQKTNKRLSRLSPLFSS
jgi:hypothetical protein